MGISNLSAMLALSDSNVVSTRNHHHHQPFVCPYRELSSLIREIFLYNSSYVTFLSFCPRLPFLPPVIPGLGRVHG